MVIQDCAYYEGKRWFAYELKDISGNYHEEYRLKMRMESQKNAFTCPDCGEPLILCAGVVMEPHFRHYEDTKCILPNVRGSSKSIVSKRMIYHMLKKSFPEKEIISNQILDDEIYLDFIVKLDDYPDIAIKYMASEPKLEKFKKDYETLQMMGYQPIFIMKYLNKYKDKALTTFQYLVNKLQGEIYLLDIDYQSVYVKKNMKIMGENVYKEKEYPLADIFIKDDGILSHDLNVFFQREIDFYEKGEMDMVLLDEIWIVPDLIGIDYYKKKANKTRFEYLINQDKQLAQIKDEAEREWKKNKILEWLGEAVDVGIWSGWY